MTKSKILQQNLEKLLEMSLKTDELENILNSEKIAQCDLSEVLKSLKITITIPDVQLLRTLHSPIKTTCSDACINYIYYQSEAFPHKLLNAHPKILLMSYFGDINLLTHKYSKIAFIGTRKPTVRGKNNTETYIKEISKYRENIVIVSGLAYGIDGLSHELAIQNGMKCIAVLGSGLQNVYPKIHLKLAEKILSTGGLILSEYPLKAPPLPHHFPLRNRIIAGISDCILVIESGNNSGSAITAKLGLDFGTNVFAIPYDISYHQYQGNNTLIKNNIATLTNSPNDIVLNLNIKQEKKRHRNPNVTNSNKSMTPKTYVRAKNDKVKNIKNNQISKAILDILKNRPLNLDQIFMNFKDKHSLQLIQSELTTLELNDHVFRCQTTGRYIININD